MLLEFQRFGARALRFHDGDIPGHWDLLGLWTAGQWVQQAGYMKPMAFTPERWQFTVYISVDVFFK